MKGLVLLLQSLGLKITPEELETAWNGSKDALPRLAASFEEIVASQKRIEEKLDRILNTPVQSGYSISEFIPNTEIRDVT